VDPRYFFVDPVTDAGPRSYAKRPIRSPRAPTARVQSSRYIITPWQQTRSKVRPPHS